MQPFAVTLSTYQHAKGSNHSKSVCVCLFVSCPCYMGQLVSQYVSPDNPALVGRPSITALASAPGPNLQPSRPSPRRGEGCKTSSASPSPEGGRSGARTKYFVGPFPASAVIRENGLGDFQHAIKPS